MAEPTDPGPVVTDDELVVNLTRLLNIRGPLGLLSVLNTVVPVVSLGNVVEPVIRVDQPSFRSTDIFSAGILTAAAINTVHADTLALPAGTYDVIMWVSPGNLATNPPQFAMQHRNAADAATLAVWNHIESPIRPQVGFSPFSFGYVLAANERLRIINLLAVAAGETSYATIWARVRPSV